MQSLREGLRLTERYVLLRRLGAGGTSESWLARDERADSNVALKFLRATPPEETERRQSFRKEWQLASRLMHPHIARVFEYHDDSEAPFFAMQYIAGDDIGALANEPLDVALPPFGLLADALRYTHGKGIVHRDIKSSNVLLDARGVPHLIDFGTAAAGGGSAINASPAQRSGAAPAPADDVYALGVLMHEIVTGRPPTDADVDGTLIRSSGEPVPQRVQLLIHSMLAQDAEKRPQAEAIAIELRDAGFPAGRARRARRTVRGEDADRALDVAVPTVAPATARARPAAASRRTSTARSGVSVTWVYAGLAMLVALFVGVIFVLPNVVGSGSDRDQPIAASGDDGADTAAPSAGVGEQDTLEDVQSELGLDGDRAGFSENLGQSSADDGLQAKLKTDEALGDLLSQLERLKYRGIERWGGQPYLDMLDVYAQGDEAYLNRNYPLAGNHYRQATVMLEPFFDQIEDQFRKAMSAAQAAFEREDHVEAVRQYDLAVAITPSDAAAERGLARARNLEGVLDLVSQGDQFRDESALDAAKLAYEKALELDGAWEPARVALEEVLSELKQWSFEARMSEGFAALASADYASARAAFNAAKGIEPNSREPADGLLQLDQAVRLARIQQMENEAYQEEQSEQWEAAVTTYEALLEVDADLQFAKEGLSRSRERAGLHRQLQDYIDEPDSLSDQNTMQRATQVLLDISRMDAVGPRLDDQKNQLSRLLKRAATPLTVSFVSDNATEVSVYRIGKLGTFANHELRLRPGSYVAVGVRPGYRDVRLEFRVAPEIEQGPIVVQCEEPI